MSRLNQADEHRHGVIRDFKHEPADMEGVGVLGEDQANRGGEFSGGINGVERTDEDTH